MGWRWKAFRLAAIQADYVTSLIDLLMAVLFPLGLYIHLQQRHVSQAPPSLLLYCFLGVADAIWDTCALCDTSFFKKVRAKIRLPPESTRKPSRTGFFLLPCTKWRAFVRQLDFISSRPALCCVFFFSSFSRPKWPLLIALSLLDWKMIHWWADSLCRNKKQKTISVSSSNLRFVPPSAVRLHQRTCLYIAIVQLSRQIGLCVSKGKGRKGERRWQTAPAGAALLLAPCLSIGVYTDASQRRHTKR